MADNTMHIGSYSCCATGSMTLESQGTGTILAASGLEGSVLITAGSSIVAQSGPALLTLENEEARGVATLQAGEVGSVKLGTGPEEEGPLVELEGPELLKLSVGAPGAGASITMTPESITLKVAEVSITLTPEGITDVVAEVTREVTPEGHNMSAAETDFNIGVAGITSEGPTKTEEIEGGTVENETLGSHTTDAAKNEDAGIMMEV